MLRSMISRPVCLGVKHPSGAQDYQTVASLLMWDTLSDESSGLSFAIAAGPSPAGLKTIFTVSGSRLPQPGGPGPRIYIRQEQRGPVIPPGTGFPFRLLLRLAGLRWRYSNPPPCGVCLNWTTNPRYTAPARAAQETFLPLLRALSLQVKNVHRAVS
jgi:hypothetical protein